MVDILIVEPGEALDPTPKHDMHKTGFFKADGHHVADSSEETKRISTYVAVLENEEDRLVFPHVDSCLAIAFITSDERVIGGHVGLQWSIDSPPDPEKNAERVYKKMQELVGEAKVTRIMYYANDLEPWSAFLQNLYAQADNLGLDPDDYLQPIRSSSPHPKGVNLYIDTQFNTVEDCVNQQDQEKQEHSPRHLSPKSASALQTEEKGRTDSKKEQSDEQKERSTSSSSPKGVP